MRVGGAALSNIVSRAQWLSITQLDPPQILSVRGHTTGNIIVPAGRIGGPMRQFTERGFAAKWSLLMAVNAAIVVSITLLFLCLIMFLIKHE